ncbi:MAG TPA: glycine--tRNA ligase subunit beta [Stellaceae bacterium]|nr:glycine--tRNA ligase subunit beta [Stellaceae bacterium]
MYEKAGRIKKVAGEIAWRTFLDPRLRTRAEHAAFLAKADLSTAMVGEFPELQGIIGGRYALQDGEDSRVAQAIAEHYKPLGPNDSCPSAAESVAVALADKIDSLVGLFHFGVRPTGAGDPYALRRAALGVIRMILENRLPLRLLWAFLVAFKALRDEAVETDADLLLRDLMAFRLGLGGELLSFMVERLKVHLREQGVRHDCVDAVLKPASSGEGDDDLVKLVARAEAVQQFLTWDDGAKLLVAYKRSERIVRIEEERDGRSYSEPVNDELLQEEEERLLCQRLKEVGQIPQSSFVTSETFIRAMSALASLREPVDKFFGKVTVNTDDRELRANRLCLLAGIRDTMNQIADFSQIKG